MFVALFLPNSASAFWPFFTNADAATSAIVPSASTPVLVAPINRRTGFVAPIPLATSGGSALIAYGGPTGTIVNVEKLEQSDRISVYVVRNGDTLSDIADMFDVSVNTILWANNLKNSRDVHPGDTLVILPVSGIEHTVVKGDTLKSLAKKYNADVGDVVQFNGLDPEENLEIGTTIIIPGGEIITQTTSKVPTKYNNQYGGGGSFVSGYFSNPLFGGIITQRLHGKNGIDIGAARGTPIRSSADGMVIIARSGWNGGYGNYVVISHNNGSQTLYSHMKNMIVSSGQSVSSGQIIGYVGSSGQSTGPHLHFEVRGMTNPFSNCSIGSVCSPQ